MTNREKLNENLLKLSNKDLAYEYSYIIECPACFMKYESDEGISFCEKYRIKNRYGAVDCVKTIQKFLENEDKNYEGQTSY